MERRGLTGKGLTMLFIVTMMLGVMLGAGRMEVSAAENDTHGNTIERSTPAGDGTEDNPYQIGTAGELYWFADYVNSGNSIVNAVLIADITVNTDVLDGNGELAKNDSELIRWTPIGKYTSYQFFRGTFDGRNHTISGLYFNDDTAKCVGLFGYSYGYEKGKCTISNIGVIDSYFNGADYVGGVCGWMIGQNTSIINCYNAGNVNGTGDVGGICGDSGNGTGIAACYNSGNVSGNTNVGGVCGSINTPLTKCYNTGKVSGKGNVGGVCGYNSMATIGKCYNTGKVSGERYVGGICGCNFNRKETFTACYYDSDCTQNGVGYSSASTENVLPKSTDDMHSTAFCELIGYHSYDNQSGICALCEEAYQEAPCNNGIYEISNAGQLYWFADKVNNENGTYGNANAVLTKDIVVNQHVLTSDGTLNGDGNSFKSWTPIGTSTSPFTGTFDGGNHTINGLYFYNTNTNYIGLFGYLGENGKISNVGVQDSYLMGYEWDGGICGYNSGATIENCYYTGTVSGSWGHIGGICGYSKGGVIQNCYNTGIVGNNEYNKVGGICGESAGDMIRFCYNTGVVSGRDMVSGICGLSSSTIQKCYNTGEVSSNSDIGGISGYNRGTIQNCYNTGNISGNSDIGGICGYNIGLVQYCYNASKLIGSKNIGGICGDNSTVREFSNCYFDSLLYTGEAIGSSDKLSTAKNVEGKTTVQFKSGEVTYLLQGDPKKQTDIVWGQTLTGDDTRKYPVFGGKPVYQVEQYSVCEQAKDNVTPAKAYSNSDSVIFAPHKDDGLQVGTAYDNKCDYCGNEFHQFNQETGICEDEKCGYHKGIINNRSYSTEIVYCGDDTAAAPGVDAFEVNSGVIPKYTWYQGDVTTSDLSDGQLLVETTPKEPGTYTLVVTADGVKQEGGTVYTAAELRVKVTITKAQLEGTVTIDGTLRCNETVTINTKGITNEKPGTYSYQWYRIDEDKSATEIANATGESYTLTTEDIGKKIKVVVSAAYCDGTLEATTDTFVDKLQGTATITSIPGQLSKDWDGETIVTPLVDTTNDTGESNENVIFEYKKSTEEAYTQTAPTDAGTYDVRVRVKEDAIYHEAVSEPVTFTIAKVDATVETAPIAGENLTYVQGKNITLINAEIASVTGGELKYAFSEDGIYSTSLPTVTEAGTYSVYYKVVGDRNHNDTEPVKINVTVSKAVPSYQVPTDISAVCGAKLLAVKLPTGFGWTDDEDVTLEAGDTATGIQIVKKAKYVPKDTKNYEEVTDIAITIQVTHDSEVKGVVEPTCTEKGYSGDTYCKSRNKKIQSGTDIAALGHDMAREVSAKVEATCTTDGKEAVKGCTRCDHTEGGDKIAALGHDFAKDFTVDTEATCISVGSKSRHCNRCEEKTEITEIPKSAHTWDSGKITKDATCISKGEKIYSCKVDGCNATKVEEIAINPDNHVGETEVKDKVEPTCTGKGYSGDTYCKSCNRKIQSGTDVDALGHDMAREVSAKVEATCTTDGKEAVKGCTRCDHTEGGDKIAAIGHDFAKDFTVDTEATCTTAGSKSRHCIRCEEKTEITEIPKKEHTWNDGKVTKEATETEKGVKTYSCKVCGVTRTETIPKKDAVTTQQPIEGSTVSQSPKNGDTITDNKSNAKYTVTDTVKKNVTYSAPVTIKAKTITIPATIKINGEIYKVTRIDKNALKGNKKVTKIVVGSNIQSIGDYAFSGCKKLKTIIIQSKKLTTKTVSKKAFKGIAKKVVVKVPKKKRTAYKKLLKKKGLSSKNRIKNY